jgi:ketosteroid isomerase-like protein
VKSFAGDSGYADREMKGRDFRAATEHLTKVARDLGPVGGGDGREQAHIQAVREQIDAIARGDVAAVFASAHDDVQLDIYAPPEFHWVRHANGSDAIRDAIEKNFGSVEEQAPEILNVVAQGDTVVLIGREHGIIRATGERYDIQFVEKFSFRDGRLAAVQIVAARS